jgi:hypothetical protein
MTANEALLGKNPILDPDLTVAFQAFKLDIFRSLNCVKVGQITRFDPSLKTVEVQILFKRVLPDGTIVSYPLLVDLPVVTLQGGGAALQMPISVGDQCLVFFSDRNIDAWFETGAENPPLNGRAHDPSDGFALVGVNAKTSALIAYATDEARLIAGLAKVGVKLDGSEAFVRYSDTRAWADSTGTHMQQGDALVEVKGGKVGIQGTGGTLLAALESTIDVIKALLVQDPVSGPIPLTAASIAALEAQKAVLEGVLNT